MQIKKSFLNPTHLLGTFLFAIVLLFFLISVSNLTWSTIDSELASSSFEGESSPFFSDKYSVFLILFLSTMFFERGWMKYLKRDKIIASLITIATISLLWSEDKLKTVYFLIILFSTLIFAIVSLNKIGVKYTVRIFYIYSTFIIAVSCFLAARGSGYALMGGVHRGDWRGIFPHRNLFAPFAELNLILSLFFFRKLGVLKFFVPAAIFLDALSLWEAKSSTGIISTMICLYVGVLIYPIDNRSIKITFRIIMSILTLILVSAVIFKIGTVFEVLGKDSTMSHRTQMWAQALPLTFSNPLGTGYGTGGGEKASIAIQEAVHRKDSQAVQSGYINTALELSWLTVIIYLYWAFKIIFKNVFIYRFNSYSHVLVVIVFQSLICAITEVNTCLHASYLLFVLLLFNADSQQMNDNKESLLSFQSV